MRRHSSSSLLLLMLVPEASCLLVRPGLHHLASPLPPKLLQTTPVSFAARSSSICLAEGSGSSGEGQAERVDAILQKFGDAEGLPAAQKEGEQDEGEQEPFSFERELELFKEGKGETAEFLKEFLPTFAFFLAIRIAIVEPRYIPSLSMYPSFDINDQLAVEKVSKWLHPPNRRDIVVFDPPPLFWELTGRKPDGEAVIKRVVGVAGDTVEVRNGKLFLNGREMDEPYTNELAEYELTPPLTVPAGSVFVLGDNRNHSFDSHYWGFLPTENIIGKATVRYWPPNKIGAVDTYSEQQP